MQPHYHWWAALRAFTDVERGVDFIQLFFLQTSASYKVLELQTKRQGLEGMNTSVIVQ